MGFLCGKRKSTFLDFSEKEVNDVRSVPIGESNLKNWCARRGTKCYSLSEIKVCEWMLYRLCYDEFSLPSSMEHLYSN